MTGSADSLFNQGLAQHRSGALAEAADLYRQALELAPDHAAACNNLGVALSNLGRRDEALEMFQRAVRLAPDGPMPLHGLGKLLLGLNRLPEAEAAYRAALALDPGSSQAKRNLGHALIGQERFEEGFELYENRPERLESRCWRLPFPEWRGEPLAGRRLFVFAEQGLGDQIMLARYIPVLQAMGAEITFACLPLLHRLLGQLTTVGFYPRPEEVPAHDYWVASMSLPYLLKATPATLPPAPYLRVPTAARERWAGQFPPGPFRVGFVWRGEPRNPNDANRSLKSPYEFLRLARLGVEMVDLQEPRGDFADTAAILEQLDLVIAVDTAMVHLAGALGRPCWALIPHIGADWRWAPGRVDTPWYGSVRVFREPSPGDWSSVFEAVAQALAGLRSASVR